MGRGRHRRPSRVLPTALMLVATLVGGWMATSTVSVSSFAAPSMATVAGPRAVAASAGVAGPPISRLIAAVKPPASATGEQIRSGLLETAWRDGDLVDALYRLAPLPGDSTLPPPPDSGEGRRIVYSNSQQRVWLTDPSGSVLDSYLVSGRRSVPRPGTYSVFSKSEVAWAGHNGITMRNMVRFARGTTLAIGFHSIPVTRNGSPLQTDEDLGNFRSAGCVRQDVRHAARLFAWAEIGTPVIVTP